MAFLRRASFLTKVMCALQSWDRQLSLLRYARLDGFPSGKPADVRALVSRLTRRDYTGDGGKGSYGKGASWLSGSKLFSRLAAAQYRKRFDLGAGRPYFQAAFSR